MIKKIVTIISAIALFFVFIGVAQTKTTNNVQAASFAKRNHLRPYIIPKKFRGTWRRGKDVIHITRRIGKTLTYHNKVHLKSNMAGSGKVLLVTKDGKTLVYFPPQACGMGMYRKGKYLVLTGMGCKFTYHRVKS